MIRHGNHPLRTAAPLMMQLAILLSGILVMAFAPPPRGTMLLVPLTEAGRLDMARVALDRGALLVGRGPIEGSLIVRAERDVLAPMLVRHGVLLMSAPAASCAANLMGQDT